MNLPETIWFPVQMSSSCLCSRRCSERSTAPRNGLLARLPVAQPGCSTIGAAGCGRCGDGRFGGDGYVLDLWNRLIAIGQLIWARFWLLDNSPLLRLDCDGLRHSSPISNYLIRASVRGTSAWVSLAPNQNPA